jgi:hypothetical protein
MDSFFQADIGVAALVYAFMVPIFVGYIYFNKSVVYELYTVDFTSTVGKISAVLGSWVLGVGFASAVGFLTGLKVFLIVLPFSTILGYVLGCAWGCSTQTMGIPIWIRVVFGSSWIFGATAFFKLLMGINGVHLPASQILIPLAVSILIGLVFVRISRHYRQIALILLVISELLVIFYAVVQIA